MNFKQDTEQAVIDLIKTRQARGKEKYGTTVRENQLSLREWHQHHLEELLDAAIYVMRKIQELDEQQLEKCARNVGDVLEEIHDEAKTLDAKEEAQKILDSYRTACANRKPRTECKHRWITRTCFGNPGSIHECAICGMPHPDQFFREAR